jgi:hypothetical protein
MRSSFLQSLREYASEVRRAYYSFVFGGVLTSAGAVGLFVSSQRWVVVASGIGLVLGVVTAPFQAFHNMRVQREIARGEDPFGRLRLVRGFANSLGGGVNWGIDHHSPIQEDGFAARIAVGARHAVDPEFEFDTTSMRTIRDRLERSDLEQWLKKLPLRDSGASPQWRLASPSKDFVVTILREPAELAGGGSAVYAKLTLQTPFSWRGLWPMLLLDVVVQNVYEDGTSLVQYAGAVPLAGETFQIELPEFVGLLDVLSETAINELAEPLFKPLVVRRWRDRLLRRPLRLIGPNFDARTKPTGVIDALRLPEFERLTTQPGDPRFIFETPDTVNARDPEKRLELLRRAIGLFLRRQEFIDFESYVESLTPDIKGRPSRRLHP